ncbi:MAG: HAMP domain-containing histidine kinase [Bacteroidales bacterium]|nr:HAMP domain-containing histidine kinase [Bacteroidales bacterium]
MPTDKLEKTLVSLDESAKNAFHLMDNLLNWSRSKLNRVTPKKVSFQLNNLVHETLGMFQTIINYKNLNLKVDLPPDVQLFADPDIFTCVMRNLFSNAIKYTPEGGMIKIKAIVAHDFVTIKVEDNGTGITPLEVQGLFNSTTSYTMPGLMNEKGSGLGLKLCREFTELNGGKIWADNTEKKGTRIHFTVPLVSA